MGAPKGGNGAPDASRGVGSDVNKHQDLTSLMESESQADGGKSRLPRSQALGQAPEAAIAPGVAGGGVQIVSKSLGEDGLSSDPESAILSRVALPWLPPPLDITALALSLHRLSLAREAELHGGPATETEGAVAITDGAGDERKEDNLLLTGPLTPETLTLAGEAAASPRLATTAALCGALRAVGDRLSCISVSYSLSPSSLCVCSFT